MSFLTAEESSMQNPNNAKVLLNISHKYIDFVNRMGRGEVFAEKEASAALFADDCKKIFNGRLVAADKNTFVADLLTVYANHGGWKHIPIEIINSATGDSVVLHTIIETDRMGTNTAMVILHCNPDHLISEINEVFSPVQSDYDFKTNICHDTACE